MRSLQARVRAPPTKTGQRACRRPAPPVVRRVLHRIVGGPSQRPTAAPPPCPYPAGGLRRLPAPILHGGPQIPREVPGQKHPPRPRRPPWLPRPLVLALSRSRLLAGMKTIAQPSHQVAPFGTRRAIAFQNRRTRGSRLHQSVGAGRLSRHSRRSGNPEPFLCAETLMVTGKRQAWASPGYRSVLKRQTGLWIPAAAGLTGDKKRP